MWSDEDIAAYEAQAERDEHHDNRYEDGGPFYTGTVADYDEDWLSEDGEHHALVLRPDPARRHAA